MNSSSAHKEQQQHQFTLLLALPVSQINWEPVMHDLSSKYGYSTFAAKSLGSQFVDQFSVLRFWYWFRKRSLSGDQTNLVRAICRAHHSDSICIEREGYLKSGDLNLGYHFEVRFSPYPAGRAAPTLRIRCGKSEIKLLKLRHVALLNIVAVISVILLFASLSILTFSLGNAISATLVPVIQSLQPNEQLIVMCGIALAAISIFGFSGSDKKRTTKQKRLPETTESKEPD